MITRIFHGTITAALLVLIIPTGNGSADGWTVEGVDWANGLEYPGNQNLQLHSAGYPCITYDRFYAWFDGINWHREVFDESSLDVGQSSLCLDGTGEPESMISREIAGYEGNTRSRKLPVGETQHSGSTE